MKDNPLDELPDLNFDLGLDDLILEDLHLDDLLNIDLHLDDLTIDLPELTGMSETVENRENELRKDSAPTVQGLRRIRTK